LLAIVVIKVNVKSITKVEYNKTLFVFEFSKNGPDFMSRFLVDYMTVKVKVGGGNYLS